MKILCFADLHIGVKTYGKIDPVSGLNTREIQALNVLDKIIDYSVENNIPVIVGAGDMYKNNLPSPTLQDEFNKRIKRASDAGKTVLLLDGNHDVSKLETSVSAIKSFDTLDVPNVIHTRFHKEYGLEYNGKIYQFVFLPTHHTKEQIEDIVNNVNYQYPTIFIGHMTIKDAFLNEWLIAEKETYIDAEIFNKPNVKAVVLGHLHKFQILNQDPFVFYTGSSQRIDFNEENQEKLFVELDIDDNTGELTYDTISIDNQRFVTLKFKFNDSKNATETIIARMKNDFLRNAIVRIQVELDELTKIEDKEIYDCGYSLGAMNMLSIQKFYNSEDKNKRNSGINEHITIEKGLEIYYNGKPREKERIKLGKEIINKIENDL